MKDLMVIWNTLSRRQIYSSVNINPNIEKQVEQEETRTLANLQRKSSVVVNKFFNAALPVRSDSRQKWSKNIFMLMTLGLLGLASGCIILLCDPYELLFKWKATFGEGGESFEFWQKPEVDLYVKIYLFNVTNHDEFQNGEASKLRFQEVGPYVYKETFEHANVVFNDNGTLSTIPVHPLKYVPEMSIGTEEDLVIMPNIALFSITNVMKDASYLSRWGLNMLIRRTNTKPIVPMTAHEFMFGYQSTLVTLGNHLMPSWIKFDKLGLIDRMYDFDGDFETIYTGETDIRTTGLIDKYNGDTNLPQWTGKCANVQGASDGVKFPSYIEPNDTLLFFRKSLCRSERLVRVGEKVLQGLDTYQYTFMENELDNGAVNPENKCFCRKGFCLKPGLIDVTDCYYGFPIALSYPHFYKSDPSLLEAVEGLEPKKELHESYFYIQPKSGIPMNLASRFQINMVLQNIGHMAMVEKFPHMTIPLLWFEIGMYKLPLDMNIRFWFYLNFLPIMTEVSMYLLFLSGAVLLVWCIMRILSHHTKKSSSEWLELERKRRKVQTDKQIDPKVKDIDVYSTLLTPGDPNLTMV
ncbi:PREDICTED: scavenger receptor class B member 1-like [Cyphomyrmex costatus]|uniref:Scavenger receptor class B member 1 n=1 Tax=Cyphomyrmex costatus TaxID=456900 RepID=A0A195D4Q2_9HYME|nr:PREDICTED: scavenger receptor class B member 1-like [Cyphomyrmex costatus]KYN07821.1 Scavenger receptor class B member 1 [Cyphomyrmex costatus]